MYEQVWVKKMMLFEKHKSQKSKLIIFFITRDSLHNTRSENYASWDFSNFFMETLM